MKQIALKEAAQQLKKAGRGGDTELVHVNKREEEMLRRMGGLGSVNPITGLKEYKDNPDMQMSPQTTAATQITPTLSYTTTPITGGYELSKLMRQYGVAAPTAPTYADGGRVDGPDAAAAATPAATPTPAQGGANQALFADALANVRAQRSALDDMLTRYTEQKPGGDAETWFRLAAAFGAPTRTGTFGETLGNVGTSLAESTKGSREEGLKNMQLRLDAQKYKTESAKEELMAALASKKEEEDRQMKQKEYERLLAADARKATHMTEQELEWRRSAARSAKTATDTGILSQDAIDVAANLYVQTGSLPSFGFGKNAVEMRARVLNKAAEISSGKAPSAEESAANITAAKQKTAATAAMRRDLATGTTSRSINAINTADQHAGLLLELSRAQQNGDTQAVNRITNSIATQFGDPRAKNVDVAAAILSREIGKTMSTTAGTAHEAEEMTRQFGSINSIAQAAGVAQTARKLMQGKMDAIRLQGRSNGVPSDELEGHFNPSLRIQPPKAPAKQPAGQVVDSRGWVLHQDKNGVKFYLSPDGKQYSRVR